MTQESGSYAPHSRVGASSAERFFNCPGSVRLAAQFENVSSEYAQEGTAAHEIAAVCLKDGEDAWVWAGYYVNPDYGIIIETVDESLYEGAFEVDEEMVEAVQMWLDVIRADIDCYREERGEDPIVMVERSFHMKDYDDRLYGTSDCSIIFPAWGELKVYDYKHGQGIPVYAEHNKQLKYYACGVIYELGAEAQHFSDVELVIVAPRCVNMTDPVSRWSMDVEHLGHWLTDELMPAIKRTEDPDAPLNPGAWCRFCPARGQCPALHELAEDFTREPNEVPELEDWEIAERYAKLETLRIYMRAIEDEAFKRMMKGRELPGIKLVPKKATRVFKENADKVLAEHLGEDVIYERKLKTPAALEKARGAKKLVQSLSYKPDTGLTIAPEDDSRHSVPVRKAADVFADVDPDQS
jgi:hypothetical protein